MAGFKWDLVRDWNGIFTVMDVGLKPNLDLIGAPGVRTFRIKTGPTAGEGKFRIELVKPWNITKGPEDVIEFPIYVQL